MFKLEFTDTPSGKELYEIVSQSYAVSQRPIRFDEWDTAVDLLRKIKSLGTPTEKLPDGTQLFDLRSGGGEIELAKAEMNFLLSMMEGCSWKPLSMEKVVTTRDWLKNLPWPK